MLQQNHPANSGNILIYILGAIFLMGMLIVALKGSFQEGTGIDAEKTALLVGQVQRYGAELERGVRYVQQNGYSETEIRFAHPNAESAYGLITDIPARQIFDPQGGGVEWKAPPAGLQLIVTPWIFNGGSTVEGVGSTCTASSCSDLVALLMNVTKDFCLHVNNSVSIINPSGNPPQEAGSVNTTRFSGTFSYATDIRDNTNHLRSKSEGCFEGGSNPPNGTYHYYRVLLAR